MKQAVDRIPFLGGRTYTTSALRMLRQAVFVPSGGDRETVPNFAIIVTDGNSNINPEQTIPEAIQARIAGRHLALQTWAGYDQNESLIGTQVSLSKFTLVINAVPRKYDTKVCSLCVLYFLLVPTILASS